MPMAISSSTAIASGAPWTTSTTRQVALFWRQGSHPGAARLAFQALALELGAELGDA